MGDQDTGKPKRVTPGRSAKTSKRKLSSEDQERTVKQKLDSQTMALSLEQLRAELAKSDEKTAAKIDKSMLEMSNKMEANTALILAEKLERREEMSKMQAQIDALARGTAPARPESRIVPADRGNYHRRDLITRSEDHYHKYQRARRSLMLYPIQGANINEIMASFQIFLWDQLQIPEGEIQREQVEMVRRFSGTRNSRARYEVIALFTDNETRDFVLSHARNLAGKNDIGVRIDVPPHLLGVKRTFDEYGYLLKTEIGPEFKRNIRYEDGSETLIMDTYYPDIKKWERVTYEQAVEGLEYMKKNQTKIAPPSLPIVPPNDVQTWRTPTAVAPASTPVPAPSPAQPTGVVLRASNLQTTSNLPSNVWTGNA